MVYNMFKQISLEELIDNNFPQYHLDKILNEEIKYFNCDSLEYFEKNHNSIELKSGFGSSGNYFIFDGIFKIEKPFNLIFNKENDVLKYSDEKYYPTTITYIPENPNSKYETTKINLDPNFEFLFPLFYQDYKEVEEIYIENPVINIHPFLPENQRILLNSFDWLRLDDGRLISINDIFEIGENSIIRYN